MNGGAAKRKNSNGTSGSCKKKRDADIATEPTKQVQTRVTRASAVKEVFCIVEADGSVEDSKFWGPTIPVDMRRWLPEKMVLLIQGSMVSNEKCMR